MAQRWTFEEDRIVGVFSYEHIYEWINGELLDQLMIILAEKGYDSRSRTAVQKRANEYQHSFYGPEIPHISIQVRRLSRVIANKERNYEWSLRIDSVMKEVHEEYEEDYLNCLFYKPSDLIFLDPLATLGPTLHDV